MMTCAGAPGVALTSDEADPLPMTFFADTRKSYELLFDKPVTVVESPVPTPSANVDHMPPLVSLYSMI